jgi:hypothetical protein
MLLHSRDQELRLQRWAIHGDEEVAAGGGSGSSWRARARPGREGSRGRRGKGRRVGMCRNWRWSSGRGAGGKRRWQERNRGESGGARGRRSREVSRGLVCDFRKVQGPLCKLKFITATKVK